MTASRAAGLAIKRSIDVVGAGVLLVAGAPLLAAIALAIKLESPGPVLFTQCRAGRGGREFRILKFRSMVIDAAAHGPVTSLDDHRITRVGGFLRRNSLDELPQLLNVVKGDMSLVGPRPLLPETTRLDERRRLDMRPGMTGLVEVSDPHLLDWDERMKVDIWYVDHWSLRLDARILHGTLRIMFGRTDALDQPRT